jgi:autotransporter-associated beta strand protein
MTKNNDHQLSVVLNAVFSSSFLFGKSMSRVCSVLSIFILVGFCGSARAVNLYWVGTNAGATVSSPSDGIWDASTTPAWNTSGSGVTNSLWVSSDLGVFSGAVGDYNVTLGSAVTVLGVDFVTSGSTYNLSATSGHAISVNGGSGSLQLEVDYGAILNVGTNVTFTTSGSRSYQVGASGSNAGGVINILNGASIVQGNNGRTVGVDGFGTVVNVYAGGLLAQTSTGTGNCQLGIGGSAGASSTVNVDGGTVSDAGPAAGSFLTVGGAGDGVLTVNSGMVSSAATSGGLRLAQNPGVSGTLNLNGGTMIVPILFKGGDNTATATINFNGGTLQANANNSSFMNGLSAANVLAGGAVIDDGGKAITIGQGLLNGSGSDGGLTKLGAGTLTLSGPNTYNGATTVSAGALVTSSDSIGGGAYIVADDATLEVQVNTPGTSLVNSSLTLGNVTGCTLGFSLGGNASATMPAIQDNGAVNLNGTVTINVDGTLGAGTNLLMTYDSITGSGNFVLGSAPVVVGYAPKLISSGTKLELVYVAPPSAVTWAVGDGSWDTNTFNWVATGTAMPTNYSESAPVTFDDSASGSSPITVTLTDSHRPNVITNDSTKDYILTDGGNGYSLSGNGGLVKSGSGTLTLDLDAAYTGNTLISEGAVALGGSGAISGSAQITVATNATLNVSARSDQTLTLNSGQMLTGSGSVLGNISVSSGATVAPGDAVGVLTVQSNIVLNGTTVMELNRDNVGQTNDELVSVTGDIVGGGTLTVTNLGSTLQLDDTFQLFNQPVSGFTSVDLPNVSPYIWNNNLSGNGSIKVVPSSGTLTWTGMGTTNAPGNGNWDMTTGNMWNDGATDTGDSVWLTGYNAVFGGVDGSYAVNVNSALTAYNVAFQNSGYTLSATSGHSIQLTEGALAGSDVSQIQMAPGTTNIIGTNVTMGAAATCFIGGSDITPAGALILQGGTISQGNSGYSINIDGVGTYVSVADGGAIHNTSSGGGGATITVGAQVDASCTLSVDGGSVFVSGPNQKINVGTSGAGTLIVNSGLVSMPPTSTTSMTVGNGAVDLNGGVINVPQVTGYGTFNFNGGSLKANQDQSSFLSLGTANVLTNGAVIDDGGHAIGISQTLLSGSSPDGGLTKLGTGILTLSAANTYTGETTVSNGTLALANSSAIANSATVRLVDGAIFDVSAVAPFSVSASQVLTGAGTINGSVQVDGLLAPVGTLTFNNDLTINGNLKFGLNKLEVQSNGMVVVNGTLNNASTGTLTITNLGTALAVGDKFTLFNQALPNGKNLTIVPPSGVTFTNELETDGSIQVLTAPAVASNPTNITFNVSGNTLSLSWPADHLGWIAQYNSINLANSNDWIDIPNSQNVTNLVITIDPEMTNVFYRIRKP